MQRGRVDNEHAEGCACKDSSDVPVVAHNLATEGECELGLDRVHIEALHYEYTQVRYRKEMDLVMENRRPMNGSENLQIETARASAST